MPDLDFFGESFGLVDEPSEWAMLEFAEAAGGTETNELAGLAAIMRLLEASIEPADWQRFKSTARKNKAKIERDLMPVVVTVFTGQTDRPTQQPSDSSAGLPSTEQRSTVGSSSRASTPYDEAIGNLNGQGRRDLALFLVDARDTA